MEWSLGRWLLVLCLLFYSNALAMSLGNNSAIADRHEKFLSIFSIVRFSNDMCTGTSGYNGTCMTSAECTLGGGTAAGNCASGFGVCCVFTVTSCGSTVNRNCTYWQNPGTNSGYTAGGQCLLNVQKCSSNICQLRLDFLSFSIAQPESVEQQCTTDLFTATGASNSIPVICGDNVGQHMYLDMIPGASTWQLGFVMTGTSTSRTWNIKVTQIPCDVGITAPDQCLQYYTSSTGTVMSFNYASVQVTTGTAGRQLANQDYTICIRMNQGFCGICYSVCTDANNAANPASFSISGDQTAATNGGPLFDTACTNDWLQIPCASTTMNSATQSATGASPTTCVSRICGNAFASVNMIGSPAAAVTSPLPVYSYSKPFELRFHTDSTETSSGTTEVANLGFCLNYVQQPCLANQG